MIFNICYFILTTLLSLESRTEGWRVVLMGQSPWISKSKMRVKQISPSGFYYPLPCPHSLPHSPGDKTCDVAFSLATFKYRVPGGWSNVFSLTEGPLHNGMNSLQLFVVDFDEYLVWEMLVLPSNAQSAPNLPSLKGNRWRYWRGVISAVWMPVIDLQ